MALREQTYIVISNSIFINCFSFSNYGCLFVSENSILNFTSSKFLFCNGLLILFQENYTPNSTISDSKMFNNNAKSSLFDLSNTNLIVVNSNFENNENNVFSCISSFISIIKTNFTNLKCLYDLPGCLISGNYESTIQIYDSFFFNLVHEKEEGMIYLENSQIQIFSTKIQQTRTGKRKGDFLSVINSSIKIIDSINIEYYSNWGYIVKSNLTIANSTFSNSVGVAIDKNDLIYAVILCLSCTEISISETFFYNNTHGILGAALQIVSNNDVTEITRSYNFKIINSTFEKNEAESGGAIYINIKSGNFIFEDCFFKNNKALRGGGAINIENDDDSIKSLIQINRNKFINNMAYEGGAIKFKRDKPDMREVVYINNSAQYGDNIAGFPCRMIMLVYNKYENETLGRLVYNSSSQSKVVKLFNITSGVNIPYVLEFQILDIFNEIVSLDLLFVEIELKGLQKP